MRKLAARKYRDKYSLVMLVIFFFYIASADSQSGAKQVVDPAGETSAIVDCIRPPQAVSTCTPSCSQLISPNCIASRSLPSTVPDTGQLNVLDSRNDFSL